MTRPQLADVPWALAAMGYRPSDAWLARAARASLELQLPDFEAPELARLAWALATFAWMPPADWLRSFGLEAAYQRKMSTQAYAALLWAMASFQVAQGGCLGGRVGWWWWGGAAFSCLFLPARTHAPPRRSAS
jgi:hypothetical protein